LTGDLISWIFFVQNVDDGERLPAVGGVICVPEEDAEEDTSSVRILLRPEIEQEINNSVKQIIIVDNRDKDIRQIVNVKQVLTNILLLQVAQAGRNVNQTINQIARQVAAEGAAEAQVEQFIEQLANQTATGKMGAVNQTVTQLAEELAGTGGDASMISQLIEDFASQIATSALDVATSAALGDNDDRNTTAPTGGNVTGEGNSANNNTSDTGENNTTRATTAATSNSVTRDTDFISDYDETADNDGS
jgi:hypothetical protein